MKTTMKETVMATKSPIEALVEMIEDQERLVSCYWDDYCDTKDWGYYAEYQRQLKKLEIMRTSVKIDTVLKKLYE